MKTNKFILGVLMLISILSCNHSSPQYGKWVYQIHDSKIKSFIQRNRSDNYFYFLLLQQESFSKFNFSINHIEKHSRNDDIISFIRTSQKVIRIDSTQIPIVCYSDLIFLQNFDSYLPENTGYTPNFTYDDNKVLIEMLE